MIMMVKWLGWSQSSLTRSGAWRNCCCPVCTFHSTWGKVGLIFFDFVINTCALQEREYQPDPMDVVMLCKEWIHSASLSQEPLMIIPKDYVDTMKGVRLQAHPRKELSNRECDELPVSK